MGVARARVRAPPPARWVFIRDIYTHNTWGSGERVFGAALAAMLLGA